MSVTQRSDRNSKRVTINKKKKKVTNNKKKFHFFIKTQSLPTRENGQVLHRSK